MRIISRTVMCSLRYSAAVFLFWVAVALASFIFATASAEAGSNGIGPVYNPVPCVVYVARLHLSISLSLVCLISV